MQPSLTRVVVARLPIMGRSPQLCLTLPLKLIGEPSSTGQPAGLLHRSGAVSTSQHAALTSV